jgi:uncharacterized protein (DUF1330 family)
MTAYILARVDIQNAEKYREYMKHSPRVIAQYGGRFIARGGETDTLEGPAETRRIVLVEFPSMERAKAFYHSPEYSAAKLLREGGGDAQFIAIDGFDDAAWEAARTASEALPPL